MTNDVSAFEALAPSVRERGRRALAHLVAAAGPGPAGGQRAVVLLELVADQVASAGAPTTPPELLKRFCDEPVHLAERFRLASGRYVYRQRALDDPLLRAVLLAGISDRPRSTDPLGPPSGRAATDLGSVS